MKKLMNRIKTNTLTDEDRILIGKMLEEQADCIKYYSQSFAGTWDNNVCNINWRAVKCNNNIEAAKGDKDV